MLYSYPKTLFMLKPWGTLFPQSEIFKVLSRCRFQSLKTEASNIFQLIFFVILLIKCNTCFFFLES